MRVLVTGATGYVGTAVIDELVAAGHKVLGVARSDAGAHALEARGIEVHRGDLTEPATPAVRGVTMPVVERPAMPAHVTLIPYCKPRIAPLLVSVTVTVCVAAVFKVRPFVKLWMPASPAVKE